MTLSEVSSSAGGQGQAGRGDPCAFESSRLEGACFFTGGVGSDFVEEVRQQVAAQSDPWPRARAVATFPVLIKHCARRWRLTPEELAGGSRRESVAEARAVVSYLAVRELGLPIVVVAQDLCVSPTAVRMAVTRGEAIMAREGITPEELLGGRGA